MPSTVHLYSRIRISSSDYAKYSRLHAMLAHYQGRRALITSKHVKKPSLHDNSTNLWAPLITVLLVLLLLLSLLSWAPSPSSNPTIPRRHCRHGGHPLLPSSVISLYPMPHLQNLILVACHSVYTSMDYKHPDAASSWVLLDYQQKSQPHSFLQHIQMGVEKAADDPQAALIFSGGKTRPDAGPRAEALGYWMVAESMEWYDQNDVRLRAFTEEHARDSYENLLFSLCRFYELTGHFPFFITLIGYDFKETRFIDIHRAAVGYPAVQFEYLGTPASTILNNNNNNNNDDGQHQQQQHSTAEQGEAKVLAMWEKDMYGCHGDLAAKRRERDPFAWGPISAERCPPMAELLDWCGPGIFDGVLPW